MIRNLQRKHKPNSRSGRNSANLIARNSKQSKTGKEVPVSKSIYDVERGESAGFVEVSEQKRKLRNRPSECKAVRSES